MIPGAGASAPRRRRSRCRGGVRRNRRRSQSCDNRVEDWTNPVLFAKPKIEGYEVSGRLSASPGRHQCASSIVARLRSCSHSGFLAFPTEIADAAGIAARCPHLRRPFLITSLRPDHASSIAQTLTSTSPIGVASSRTTSSVTSVSTPETFFGQETRRAPSWRISCESVPPECSARERYRVLAAGHTRPARTALSNSTSLEVTARNRPIGWSGTPLSSSQPQ